MFLSENALKNHTSTKSTFTNKTKSLQNLALFERKYTLLPNWHRSNHNSRTDFHFYNATRSGRSFANRYRCCASTSGQNKLDHPHLKTAIFHRSRAQLIPTSEWLIKATPNLNGSAQGTQKKLRDTPQNHRQHNE